MNQCKGITYSYNVIEENNVKKYKEEDEEYIKAIIELAVLNEYATRLYKKSCYISGKESLLVLKRYLYPYWLMYLGVKKEDFF